MKTGKHLHPIPTDAEEQSIGKMTETSSANRVSHGRKLPWVFSPPHGKSAKLLDETFAEAECLGVVPVAG